MTSHELAKLLLMGKDMEIGFMQYQGGNDEWVEIESIEVVESEYTYDKLLVKSY
jgi:hypothetical protein